MHKPSHPYLTLLIHKFWTSSLETSPLRRHEPLVGRAAARAHRRRIFVGGMPPVPEDLFDGHVPHEQWMFCLTSVWQVVPALLISYPEYFSWQNRLSLPLSPWMLLFVNLPLSLLHWADYEPRSLRQGADVLCAGLLLLLIIAELTAMLCAPDTEASEVSFTILLGCACAVLCELDVFHAQHSGGRTTHVTGTNLHTALRISIYHGVLFCCGSPATTLVVHGVAAAHVRCILHSATAFCVHIWLCGVLWERWGLHLRKPARPTTAEHVIGISLSLVYVLAHALSMQMVTP